MVVTITTFWTKENTEEIIFHQTGCFVNVDQCNIVMFVVMSLVLLLLWLFLLTFSYKVMPHKLDSAFPFSRKIHKIYVILNRTSHTLGTDVNEA